MIMKRIANVTKLKEGKAEEYLALHDKIWDEVVEVAHKYGLRNFTMFRVDNYLFSYYEYVGDDFAKDMAEKAQQPGQAEWQAATGAFKDLIEGKPAIILDEFWHHDF